MRDTDLDWNHIAETEPYWGVLSAEEYRSSAMTEEARARFFESGERQVQMFMNVIRRHFDREFKVTRALDFGCGVGRLLIPIARIAEQAVGVDVADKMLELAAANLAERGITNAAVVKGDDTLSRVEGRFNFINSYIVLQHIEPRRGYRLINRLIDLLEIGGFASLQLTYGKHRKFLVHESRRAAFYRRDGNHIVDLMELDDANPPGTIQMYDYDLNVIFAMVSRVVGSPMIMLPTGDDGHLGLHFIFRKHTAPTP